MLVVRVSPRGVLSADTSFCPFEPIGLGIQLPDVIKEYVTVPGTLCVVQSEGHSR